MTYTHTQREREKKRNQDRMNLYSSSFMSILYPEALPIHVSNINNLIHFFSYFSPYLYNPTDICINKHCVIIVFVIVSKNGIIVYTQLCFT